MKNSEALAQIREGIEKEIQQNGWGFSLYPKSYGKECCLYVIASQVTDRTNVNASCQLVKNYKGISPESSGDLDDIKVRIDQGITELKKYASLCGLNGHVLLQDPVKELIAKYKEDIRLNGLREELYKWHLLQEYKGMPDLEALDFTVEVKRIDYSNLIYGVGIGVIYHLAKDRPEEYRACYRILFDEALPLSERLNHFSSETLKLFRELQPNPKHSHHHDERTMATLLTYYNPDRYALYKDSFYQKYCKLLGIKPKKVGEKYLHYLELLEEFIMKYLAADKELLGLIDNLLPDDAFKDKNHKVLAQDILYRMLDKGLEEIEIGDASVYKISMGDFNDQEIADCIDQKKIIVHQNTKPLGQMRESQGLVYSTKMSIGDYFYLTPGNRNQAVSLLGRITGPAAYASYNNYGDDEWLERSFEIIATPKNRTKYTGKQKWWTPNSRTTCVAIDHSELDEANKLLIEPYFMARLVSNADEKVDAPDLEEYKSKNETIENRMPLNQILFGPPGTGKTYNTINKALEILGEKAEGVDRAILKGVFEGKVASGQIMFTTFHQSMSYEDFIEGIKPKSENEKVLYEIEEGIFKSICNKARPSSGNFEEVIEDFKKEVSEADGKEPLTITSKASTFDVTYRGTNVFYVQPHNSTKEKPWYPVNILNIRKAYESGSFDGVYNPTYVREIIKHLEKQRGLIKGSLSNEAVKPFVLIIDEINRGNVSQIFGELITLIEEDKRLGGKEQLEVILPYSKEKFGVPANLFIIGTMNTADRSVEALDTALRRRFSFVEMPPRYDLDKLQKEVEGYKLADILKKINRRIEKLLGKDNLIGHSYFLCVENAEDLRTAFQNKIIPLLQEYFYGDYGKIGLVLGEGFLTTIEDNDDDIFASFSSYDVSGLAEKEVYHLAELVGEDRLNNQEFDAALHALMK